MPNTPPQAGGNGFPPFSTLINIPTGGLPGLALPASASSSAPPQAGPSNSASDSGSGSVGAPGQDYHPAMSSIADSMAEEDAEIPVPAESRSGSGSRASPGPVLNAQEGLGGALVGPDLQMINLSRSTEATDPALETAPAADTTQQPPSQPLSTDPQGSGSSAHPTAPTSMQTEIRKAENEKVESDKSRKKKEDEEKLAQIYEGLDFDGLWSKLSESLSRMEDDSSAAMILLPLIESLMVVSKHVATPEAAFALENISARGSVSPVTETRPPPKTPREVMSENFFTFTERHRKILNTMVRANPSLMSGSFSLLVHNPKVLDFDNKRNYFTQQLHKGRREHYTNLNLSVRRQYVFSDSFHYFARHNGPEIKHGKLNVRFYNEEGVDAGGVTREWFQVLARAMFNPDYALFAPCAADRTTYQPNRASEINPDHLAFFKFVGRVIGKAIYDGRLLDAYFTRSFYKHILGKSVDYRDLEAVDPEYFKSLEWMLQNDITEVLDLTFSVDNEEFGETQVIELKPNGQNIAVTEENKMEYVKLVTEQRLTLSIRKQIDAFLDGFHDVIPRSLIRIFSETELELLISGLPDIDVDEWRNNTELHGYSQSDAVITWFWRAVRSFDQETRAKLLQFITGTSKVPLEGFGHLQGVSGDQRTNIHKTYGSDRLPAAHTCFNQLDLPVYESFEHLKKSVLLAINEGGEGFGFA